MADPGKINEWSVLAVTVWSGFIAACGVVLACWRRLRSVWRAAVFVHHLHRRFDQPGSELLQLLDAVDTGLSEQRVRQELVERGLAVAVYVCDVEGQCVFANEVLCALFERHPEQLRGNGWIGSVVEQEETHRHWEHCVTNQIPYSAEYHVKTESGHRKAATVAYAARTATGEVACYVGHVWFVENSEVSD